jgi:hypothetical protein
MVCTTLCSIRTTSYQPLSSRNTIHRDDRIHAYLTPTSKETLVKTLPLARSKRQSSVLLHNIASTTTTNASICIHTGRYSHLFSDSSWSTSYHAVQRTTQARQLQQAGIVSYLNCLPIVDMIPGAEFSLQYFHTTFTT